jgi:hypothetical protein
VRRFCRERVFETRVFIVLGARQTRLAPSVTCPVFASTGFTNCCNRSAEMGAAFSPRVAGKPRLA